MRLIAQENIDLKKWKLCEQMKNCADDMNNSFWRSYL